MEKRNDKDYIICTGKNIKNIMIRMDFIYLWITVMAPIGVNKKKYDKYEYLCYL